VLRYDGRVRLAAAIALAVLCAAGSARASDGKHDRSVRHWEMGKGFFDLQRYDEAMREFVAGYALEQRPVFLYNIGLCYARLGRPTDARDFFRRFLAQAPEGHPLRATAQVELAALERLLAAGSPSTPAPSLVPVAQAEARPATTSHSKLWWLVPIAAVLIAGAAVGIYFATRPSCDPSQLSCIDFR
jgi:hypothetical protein